MRKYSTQFGVGAGRLAKAVVFAGNSPIPSPMRRDSSHPASTMAAPVQSSGQCLTSQLKLAGSAASRAGKRPRDSGATDALASFKAFS